MNSLIKSQQQTATAWFKELRDIICDTLNAIEDEVQGRHFQQKSWQRDLGGGGEMSLLSEGQVFEKAAVNISTVHGELSTAFAKEIPGTESSRDFWASGVSVIVHPRSPLIPAVHMNTRMICTEKLWFGGGADITPNFSQSEVTKIMHDELRSACDRHDKSYYARFKKECDRYFFLPHRNEIRGDGGIFYDYLNSGNWQNDMAFTRDVGRAFINSYQRIVRNNMHTCWSAEQKQQQLIKRGRYVEFNLLYDRGTRFGLQTGGNVEAILSSLPPSVNFISEI